MKANHLKATVVIDLKDNRQLQKFNELTDLIGQGLAGIEVKEPIVAEGFHAGQEKPVKRTVRKSEAPQAEAPQAEAPQAEAPQADAPQADAPQVEDPSAEAEQITLADLRALAGPAIQKNREAVAAKIKELVPAGETAILPNVPAAKYAEFADFLKSL